MAASDAVGSAVGWAGGWVGAGASVGAGAAVAVGASVGWGAGVTVADAPQATARANNIITSRATGLLHSWMNAMG